MEVGIMKKVTIKPGEEVQVSGTYRDAKSGQVVHLVKGHNAPPTAHPHEVWEFVGAAPPKTAAQPKPAARHK
jgi:hypothetical protein